MSDEEVIVALTDIKGVGVWTAHMFLIFALRRPNVLAVGDLGVRTAIRRYYGKRTLPKPEHIEKIAVHWRPYCSYACWYLWRSLEFPVANGRVAAEKLLPKSRAKRETHIATRSSRTKKVR